MDPWQDATLLSYPRPGAQGGSRDEACSNGTATQCQQASGARRCGCARGAMWLRMGATAVVAVSVSIPVPMPTCAPAPVLAPTQ